MDYLYNKYYTKSTDISKITYLTISSNDTELIRKLPLMISLKKIFLEIPNILDIPETFISNIKNLPLINLEIIGTCSFDSETKQKKMNEQQNKILYSIQEEELLPEIEIKRKELYNPDEQKLISLLNNLPTTLIELNFICILLNYDDILNAIDKATFSRKFEFSATDCGLSLKQVEQIKKLIESKFI